jgi:hypothetical protein
MEYKQFLAAVKQQHPDLGGKEQQKLASDMNKKFKESQKAFKANTGDIPKSEKAVGSPGVIMELEATEKKIRENVIDVNSIVSIGRGVMPDGELIQHGKDGVNTKVTFENHKGARLPVNGYFIVYI